MLQFNGHDSILSARRCRERRARTQHNPCPPSVFHRMRRQGTSKTHLENGFLESSNQLKFAGEMFSHQELRCMVFGIAKHVPGVGGDGNLATKASHKRTRTLPHTHPWAHTHWCTHMAIQQAQYRGMLTNTHTLAHMSTLTSAHTHTHVISHKHVHTCIHIAPTLTGTCAHKAM